MTGGVVMGTERIVSDRMNGWGAGS